MGRGKKPPRYHSSRVIERSDDTDAALQRYLRDPRQPLPPLPGGPIPVHVLQHAAVREAPFWFTWMCRNVHCREWTHDGAWQRGADGECNYCGTPRYS